MEELDHKMRSTGWTSTDFGALFGVDEERDRYSVVLDKLYGAPPLEFSPVMQRGHFLEGGIAAWWAWMNRKRLDPLFTKTLRHPKYPHVLASPDGFIVGSNEGFEVKTVISFQAEKYGHTVEQMPPKAQLQVRICMEVTGRDRWTVIVYNGNQPYGIVVDRERDFGEFLCAQAEEMWERYIVRREMPPVGASAATTRWLQRLHPEHKRADLAKPDERQMVLIDEYAALRLLEQEFHAELDKKRDELENRLRAAVGDGAGFQWPGGKFTWKKSKDSVANVTNWEAIARGFMTKYMPMVDEQEAHIALHTNSQIIRKGARKIYFKHRALKPPEEIDEAA